MPVLPYESLSNDYWLTIPEKEAKDLLTANKNIYAYFNYQRALKINIPGNTDETSNIQI